MDTAIHIEAAQTSQDLSKTWFYRILSVAFIALAAPDLSVYIRGLVGFLILVVVAVVAGLAESSFTQVMRLVRQGISENKLLVFFATWYWIGITLNSFTRGNAVDDWRLLLGPVVLFLALGYTAAYGRHEVTFRYFQIGFILVMGFGAIFAIQALASEVGIAREMWTETQGAWIYGNQAIYAMFAMLLPVFVWRALKEASWLRPVLLLACLLIAIEVTIAGFATPVSLLLLSIPLTLILSILLSGIKRRIVALVVTGVLAFAVLVGYQYTYDNPLLTPAYDRIETFLLDPTSGGYTGAEVQVSRWYLAEISLRSFEAEPVWGMGGGNTRYSEFVGGHSSLFDALGSYGLFGGGGALVGVILVMLLGAARRFWKQRNWETLVALVSVMLLIVAGIADPYWEGWLPAFILLMARPLWGSVPHKIPDQMKSTSTATQAKPAR